MINNSIFCSIRVGAVAAAIVLAIGALGCGGDDDDDDDSPKGGSGGDESGSGGEDIAYKGPTEECPLEDPPLSDPFCYNTGCPLSNLASVTDENRQMGDCCNTVDVQRREEGMEEGDTYDLEIAFLSNQPKTNPNIANPTIAAMTLTTQLAGGDLILVRIHDVPRTADMDGPVTVKMDIFAGKLNCNGTYSFYGPDAAPKPEHEGPPNDPGRWVKKTIEVPYNGFEAEQLLTLPSPEVVANATKLTWSPRFKSDKIDYELPVKFMAPRFKVGDNWSCFGSIDKAGKWVMTAKLTLFVPVEQAKQTLVPDLMGQTLCGLFAYEPFNKSCDDGPQSEWPEPPNGYCDADDLCWIGDPTDPEYDDFWSEWYEGEDGCGDAHPCCDPAGVDSTLEPCNAWYIRAVGTAAAVSITDDEINDPSEVFSHRDNCK